MTVPLAVLGDQGAGSLGWFQELSRILQPVTEMAQATQRPDVAAANPRVHLALLAVLVVLLPWLAGASQPLDSATRGGVASVA